jgi:hypothetical protein
MEEARCWTPQPLRSLRHMSWGSLFRSRGEEQTIGKSRRGFVEGTEGMDSVEEPEEDLCTFSEHGLPT